MPDNSNLYIVLLSLHGLIRGEDLELGRDADTGGQTKYVVELTRALAQRPEVARVDLLTRLVEDADVSNDYAQPEESLGDSASIIRIPFGPRKYIRKELLWPHLSSFVDGALQRFSQVKRTPDLIHAHYADAGAVGADLASLLSVPLVFTGHSLGHEKQRRLLDSGMKPERIESRFHISKRIDAEEQALSNAALVVASTRQEAQEQYAQYDHYRKTRTVVIPPGVNLNQFRPPQRHEPRAAIEQRITRFLERPERPWILAIARPDERKNFPVLIDAFGQSPELQEIANLVLIPGNRDDIAEMEEGPRTVLQDILLRIDRYNLYGKVAYPKKHLPDEAPLIYRMAAKRRGIFVNPAWTEPFGLTLLEAAASGLPLAATDDGGPRDILGQCKNGHLIDPFDSEKLAEMLLEMLTDRKRWRRWSRSGLREVHRHYTWEGHARNYLREARKVLGRPKRRKRTVDKVRLPSVDRILITDIDNTLLGDEEALAALRERLREAGDGTAFAVATGRRLQSAIDVLREHGAPRPDLWITSVGSQIHYSPDFAADKEWIRNISWRWDAELVTQTLRDLPGLELQAAIDQGPHKVSFFIDPAKAPAIRQLDRMLRQAGVRSQTIFSHGQFLDVLPVRASKGLAVRFVAHRWGVPMERVLVAGDSGNDEGMLAGRSLGVVVANYSPELEKLRNAERIHFAERPYAWGILEGVEHYDFFGEIRSQS